MTHGGRKLGQILGLVLCLSAATAQAAPLRFDFRFENSGASVVANGFIVFESTLIPNPSSCSGPITLPDASILDLEVTVSGLAAPAGGVFHLSDFERVAFCTANGTLDLNAQLVGQSVPGGTWGQFAGDFNLFDAPGGNSAPNGEEVFFLCPADGNVSSCMNLVSMQAAGVQTNPAPVLSPASLALAALLLCSLGLWSVAKSRDDA